MATETVDKDGGSQSAVDNIVQAHSEGAGPALVNMLQIPESFAKPFAWGYVFLCAICLLVSSVCCGYCGYLSASFDSYQRESDARVASYEESVRAGSKYNSLVYNRMVAIDADLAVMGIHASKRYGPIPAPPDLEK